MGAITPYLYHQPAGAARAVITEKKSEFIAQLSPALSEEEALSFLADVRAAHRTANHNVYAYLLRENARARYSDDGEPAKTAGFPVLTVIEHAEIVNVIIVVTRYFGGTKLGTGGLVRAYTAAAQAAVQAASIATVRSVVSGTLTLPYPLYDTAQRLLLAAGAQTDGEPVFTDNIRLSFTLPEEDVPALVQSLRELLRGGEGLVWEKPHFAPW